MPKLFVAANYSYMAYVLDGGGSGYSPVPPGHISIEVEYIAVMYALNEYFLKWNKELDSRQDNLDRETGEFYRVATPAQQTPRPLPPPVLVCVENEVVVKRLRQEYRIVNPELMRLAQQIWQMTQNVQVKFEWISREQNPARKMLPQGGDR